VPKLCDKLADEAQDLVQKARAIKIPKSHPGKWEVEYRYEFGDRFCGFGFVEATSARIREGRLECHT
jgi:hypothetical protein